MTELINCMLPGSKIAKLEKAATLLDAKVKGSLGGLAVASYNGPTCNVIEPGERCAARGSIPLREVLPWKLHGQTSRRMHPPLEQFQGFLGGLCKTLYVSS